MPPAIKKTEGIASDQPLSKKKKHGANMNEQVAKTIQISKDAVENIRDTQKMIHDARSGIEETLRKWEEFQSKFEQMNTLLVSNIASSLKSDPTAARFLGIGTERMDAIMEVEHEVISIDAAAAYIHSAKNVVVLTGAGISLASGIPTYRGYNGTWTVGSKNYTPQEIATNAFFEGNPHEAWKYYFDRHELMSSAKPNAGHHALRDLEQGICARGGRFTLITQNIDNLHIEAGSKPLEIHGNLVARCRCTGCGVVQAGFPSAPAFAKGKEAKLPSCQKCHKMLRPHVLWFDESYSEEYYRSKTAIEAVENADVLLTIGTMFTTGLPQRILRICERNSTAVIDVNPNPNEDDIPVALKQLIGKSEELIPQLVRQLK